MPFQPMPFGIPSMPRTGLLTRQLPAGFGGLQPQMPSPGLPQPMPFEGFGGGYKGAFGAAGNPFAMLMSQLGMGGMSGMVGGGMGSRGPAPNPFLSLARFAGPFGNGGGPISPGFSGGYASPFPGFRPWS